MSAGSPEVPTCESRCPIAIADRVSVELEDEMEKLQRTESSMESTTALMALKREIRRKVALESDCAGPVEDRDNQVACTMANAMNEVFNNIYGPKPEYVTRFDYPAVVNDKQIDKEEGNPGSYL